MALEVETTRIGGRALLRLGGRLDLVSSDELRAALSHALDDCPSVLVVDLADVEFMDSTGLGVLVAAQRKAGGADCRILLAGARPMVATVLDVTGVAAVLPRYDTAEQALAG